MLCNRNQDGMIFPLTVIVSLIVSFVILVSIDMYKTEMLFLEEQEEMLQLQTISQLGIVEVTANYVNTTSVFPISGSYYYPTGSIKFLIEMFDSDSVLIQAQAATAKNHIYRFKVIIDIETKQIKKWAEG